MKIRRIVSCFLAVMLFVTVFAVSAFAAPQTYRAYDLDGYDQGDTFILYDDGTFVSSSSLNSGTYTYYDIGIVLFYIDASAYGGGTNEYGGQYYLDASTGRCYDRSYRTVQTIWFDYGSGWDLLLSFPDSGFEWYNEDTGKSAGSGTFTYLGNKTVQLSNGEKYILSMTGPQEGTVVSAAAETYRECDANGNYTGNTFTLSAYPAGFPDDGFGHAGTYTSTRLSSGWYTYYDIGIVKFDYSDYSAKYYLDKSAGKIYNTRSDYDYFTLDADWTLVVSFYDLSYCWKNNNTGVMGDWNGLTYLGNKTVQLYSGSKYTLSKTGSLTGTAVSASQSSGSSSSVSISNGWQKSGNTWYYYKNSVKQTGWLQYNNYWYYLDPNAGGAMLSSCFAGSGSNMYYFGSDGKMATGWQKIDGTWYYFRSWGRMITGWEQYNGYWYYMDESGAMAANQWLDYNGSRYYLNESGRMVTGWQKLNDLWYYFGSNGKMLTGWQWYNGYWYYMDGRGVMAADQWLDYNGSRYYLDESGRMVTGWQKLDGRWYYFASNGSMLSGWQKYNGYWYFMDYDDGMLSNVTANINQIDYTFDSSGKWIG